MKTNQTELPAEELSSFSLEPVEEKVINVQFQFQFNLKVVDSVCSLKMCDWMKNNGMSK